VQNDFRAVRRPTFATAAFPTFLSCDSSISMTGLRALRSAQ